MTSESPISAKDRPSRWAVTLLRVSLGVAGAAFALLLLSFLWR